jgi:hypothetical protein
MSNTAQTNMRLTNYAQGISQDLSRKLADFIAPRVPTGGSYGQFKKFSDKNAFQVYDTARAMGGEARTIEFADSDPYYNCTPQALKIGIDDAERKRAGDNDRLLEEAKVKTLVSAATLSHEAKVFAKVFASLTAVAGKGVWSNAAVDPVAQLNEQIKAISDETGIMPNRIVFGLSAWAVFIDHTLVKARQPGAELIAMTTDKMKPMLLNPSMQIEIGVLSKDSKKFGADKSATNIVGGEVIIFYGQDNPSLYDPSAFKTFETVGGGVDSVKQYRDNSRSSDMYQVDWSEDIQDVAPTLARRITLS